ncbi:hypothetical protein SAMD00019534_018640 [Acytostelium subglobosum LB1]|uniref:hypothetical protein n=1 Tax=Acytostelium subglobosum LB1 TaxID=1410327 RepID=UPI000644DC31|nr:hypothetical protein SAMD00019534_018640 [Acytostelium subglobosum LB1]GAM18689.1 hypothetical protein SAMD00019534_018640 [Acytostelium subglobosum LB1]|eukprot:XP_012757909.1 hypothetical protein SAMD00019534_018640 [Acytostelium subglobosum LB1]
MTTVSAQLTNILKHFSKLSTPSLQKTFGATRDVSKTKRAELVTLIKALVCTNTYVFMMDDMKGFDGVVAKDLGVAGKDEVIKHLESNGLTQTLEMMSDANIKKMFGHLSLENDDEGGGDMSRAILIDRIEEECYLQGANLLINGLSDDVFEEYCKDLKVEEADTRAEQSERLIKVMFNLDEDDEEQEAEPEKPAAATKKKAPAKPAAKAAPKAPAKPAAKVTKKPAPATKKPAAAAETTTTKRARVTTKGDSVATAVSSTSKRVSKPVQKYGGETENGSAAAAPKTKATTTKTMTKAAPVKKATTTTKKRKEMADDEEEEEEEEVHRPTVDLGGYKDKDGKFVNPPISKIVKGMTVHDLHDNYNIDALYEFCKKHDILYSPYKKNDLLKVIVTFLETGVKPLSKKEKLANKKASQERANAAAKAKREAAAAAKAAAAASS